MSWYTKVSKDISNIPDAVAYFEAELQAARSDTRITGNIEKAAAGMPGVVEQRFSQLQEIEAILEYLNIELRRLRSSLFRKYLETALLRNKWLGITKGLDIKQWQLSNIIKLRVAGMEDASL